MALISAIRIRLKGYFSLKNSFFKLFAKILNFGLKVFGILNFNFFRKLSVREIWYIN